MAAVATERHPYTVSEFLALAAELERAGAQEWFEIVEGELVAYATPEDPHMRTAIAGLLFLGDAQTSLPPAAWQEVQSLRAVRRRLLLAGRHETADDRDL
jgi:hypothetical protein